MALAPPSLATATPRIVHVFVALADNQHQGIVPVPPRLGDGDDPANNLYWGAAFGVRTYFLRHTDWQPVPTTGAPDRPILERIVLRHPHHDAFLVADAYRGAAIQRALDDFVAAAAGELTVEISLSTGPTFDAGGAAALVVYVGHNGLMELTLTSPPTQRAKANRAAMVLACASRNFFSTALCAAGVEPILLTTGLMAPEAYTLAAALDGWLASDETQQIHERAALAYDRYQHCGAQTARRLFVVGSCPAGLEPVRRPE